ncbi:WhiB family transcriptional regulator [Actinosynnema mirum]|uniref:Transcription factor WhiB n=1 Tax=Actinosynnema mirum (strain ATCC 29888 / DSM 43827 / JCM 3225 / NBRC 14064 / NCIMB 13271 / NRRL B-12336 / IMRU 3971 / 101) TaxID=446462 RepID=C6WBW1_ACTMD|nr:WhiB family transcriptional regulator [Actinosynnema mirum]ACU37528.1 transcription factor WhiB [Actinosynnema mirum DSM 43827]
MNLVGIAWALDRLRWVPAEVLAAVVERDGLCWAAEDLPPRDGEELTDRELAARMCAGCPVVDECLELELRTGGELSVGVWGGLCEQDRRELLAHWLRRGERWERP